MLENNKTSAWIKAGGGLYTLWVPFWETQKGLNADVFLNEKNAIYIKTPACVEMYMEAEGIRDISCLSVLYGECSRA